MSVCPSASIHEATLPEQDQYLLLLLTPFGTHTNSGWNRTKRQNLYSITYANLTQRLVVYVKNTRNYLLRYEEKVSPAKSKRKLWLTKPVTKVWRFLIVCKERKASVEILVSLMFVLKLLMKSKCRDIKERGHHKFTFNGYFLFCLFKTYFAFRPRLSVLLIAFVFGE